jgi:8-oxo-dGTP diphosphatase
VEPGETVAQAALRELREETALSARLIGIADCLDVISTDTAGALSSHFVVLVWAATWEAGEAEPLDGARQVAWVEPERLADLVTTPDLARAVALARTLLGGAGEPATSERLAGRAAPR